jgi:hypothetical protein
MTCNNPYQLAGPFNQTLFLGCSVTNIDMNMGWGSEVSSCRVSLIKDLYRHHNHPAIAAYKTAIANRNSSVLNTENPNVNENADLPFHQTVFQKEKEKWDKISSDNLRLPAFVKDLSKHCWRTYRSNIRYKFDDPANPALVHWVSNDPGFLGDYSNNEASVDLDIIGCPVFFRFMDVWFGGMIKKWSFSNGKYEVDINSYSSLLNGCQLILGKYYGSISTIIDNTTNALPLTNQNLAVPYGDLKYPCGPNPCPNVTWPKYNSRYNGSVYQGNIPNLFNVFGHLENNNLGSSGFVEGRGVLARSVYYALVDMLEVKINRVNFAETSFNPYGAIVGRTPFDRTGQSLLDPHGTTFSMDGASLRLTEMGLIHAPTAVDGLPRSLFALDLSEVPAPPPGIYISEETMPIMNFIEYCCSNAGLDFIVDFIPMDLSVNSNYSGVIKIRTVTRNVQPKPNTIRSFILDSTFQQNVVSYNFGEEYQDVKTRSVLVGGAQERIHQFNTYTGGSMGWYRIYEPALDSFVPITSFANNSTQQNSLYNTYRMPDHANQRPIGNEAQPWGASYGAAFAQENNTFNTIQTTVYGTNINKGSYLNTIKPALNIEPIAPQNSYPLYLDIISPYFGKSNNNEYRRVYLDRKTGNLQIVVDFRDIQAFFPTQYDITDGNWSAAGQVARNLFPGIVVAPGGLAGDTTGGSITSGKFVIEEDEIRAAMAEVGPGAWYLHLQGMIQMGKPTATSKIIYNYISRTISDLFARSYFAYSLDLRHKGDYSSYVQTVMTFYSAFLVTFLLPGNRILNYGLDHTGSSFALMHPELNERQYQQSMASINSLFENIRMFVKSIGDTHYGKHFAIRLPQLVKYTNNSNGDTLYNYSIIGDGWEEPGNMIDDVMEVDSLAAQSLASENGKIPPLLGFDNSAEYDVPPTRNGTYRYFENNNLMHSSSLSPWALQNRTILGTSLRNPLQIVGITPALANRYYFPLIHNLPQDAYIMIPYTALITDQGPPGGRISFSPILTSLTAHGLPRNATSHLYKIYAKAQVLPVEEASSNPQITFSKGTPRVILALPSPVLIKNGRYDNGVSTAIAAMVLGDEEPAEADVIIGPDLNQFFTTDSAIIAQGEPVGGDGYMGVVEGSTANMYPRAAKPVFAAIPLRNNLMTYGPWVSHPGTIAGDIFPGQAVTNLGLVALINNLVGGVEIKIDPSLVPWEYGGMIPLDQAALAMVGTNNGYQQVLETGDITLAGIMLRNWTLGSYLNDYLGPIVSSIKISIGDSGVTTQYSLRTFSRKIGFYNKEQADNIKNINNAIRIQNRRLAESIKEMQTRLIQFASKPMGTRPY